MVSHLFSVSLIGVSVCDRLQLPADLQERVSSHMEKQGRGQSVALHHSCSDAVPTAVIGRVLEKPEPGRSCPVTRSPSPQAQEFPSGTDKVQRRAAYKLSDLYCSDTALYCPTDERRHNRWLERRQSADQSGQISNPEDESLPQSYSLHEDPFGSLPACYSSFSMASDEKAQVSTSQQALFTDWRDGDYEHKNPSSYGKEHPGFSKSSSFQNGGSLAHGYSASEAHGDRQVHAPEDPRGDWRQMSVEDMNTFFCSPRRASPFSFSERHFAVSPAKIKLGPLYSSFQEGDQVFHTRAPDLRFPASAGSSPALNPKISLNALKRGLMFRSKDAGQDSTSSFFKDKQNTDEDVLRRDYAHESPSSSVESLKSLDIQHYKKDLQKKKPQHQKSGNAGLSRKDSLTKAQLYGTLLN